MFYHEDIDYIFELVNNPTPEATYNFMRIICRNLKASAALLFVDIGDFKTLSFFTGASVDKPIFEIKKELYKINPKEISEDLFKDDGYQILEFDISQCPFNLQKYLMDYNTQRALVVSYKTQNKIYGLLMLLFGKPEEVDRNILITHLKMLSLFTDFYHIANTYSIVRNNISEHVVIQDLNHKIIDANKAAALSLGIEDPNELKGKYCFELWHKRSTPCVFCPLEITRNTLKPEQGEVMTPDGRWFFIRSNPILSGTGELLGFVEMTLEITDKKKAELEAERFNEILKGLFNQPLVGIVFSKPSGEIIEINEARASILGYTREELLKMKWTDYTHPEDLPKLEQRLRELKEGKRENFVEDLRVFTRNKDILWQRIFVTPLKLEGEELLLAIILDITEDMNLKKELEETLRERNLILRRIPAKIYKVRLNGTSTRVGFEEKPSTFSNLTLQSKEEALKTLEQIFKEEIKEHTVELTRRDGEQTKHFLSETIKLDGNSALLVEYDITKVKEAEIIATQLSEKYIELTERIIFTLSHLIELKEPYTAGHQMNVAIISELIGKEMGFDENRLRILKYAALLHDIGKIILPIEILNKPGKLTEFEFNLIKQHPLHSYEILKEIPFDGPVAEIALQHHERLNGSGYPRGLKNGEILLEARIITCADVYEAMTAHRPYRPALSPETALEELERTAGVLYDPEVVKIMKDLYSSGLLPKTSSGN